MRYMYSSRKLITMLNYCQCQRALGRWCTARNLLIVNCVVLLINVLFSIANYRSLLWATESYFTPSLDSESQVLLDRTFRVFAETMDSANITFFIYGGSLIGSYRHFDSIPWDDDIDVLINSTDQDRVFEALSRQDPVSFGLYGVRSYEDFIYHWKFYSKSGRSFYHGEYRMPYIDIFFFFENRTHIWNGTPYFRDKEVWPKSVIFPLRPRPFGDLMVLAPCNTEAFLAPNVEVSTCQSRSYNHAFDKHIWTRPLTVPCERLHNMYPFVRRTAHHSKANGSSIHEALVYRGITLRQVTSRAPC